MTFDVHPLKIAEEELALVERAHEFSPYAVIRRAGVSARTLQRLTFEHTIPLLDQWMESLQANAANKQKILDTLEGAIGGVESGPTRMELIHLKRDLFNDRLPKSSLSDGAMQELKGQLHLDESIKFDSWIGDKRNLDQLFDNLEGVFAREFAEKVERLCAICRKKEFRCGLEFSSPALSQDVTKYLESPQSFSRAKQTRIHRSIIRYYARSALKLSPFSTFMRTRIVQIVHAAEIAPKWQRISVERSVSLNRTFIAQLAHSLSLHPELRSFVPVSANTSMAETEDKNLLMRHDYKDRWTKRLRIPNESFAELPRHGIYERVSEVLKQLGPCALPGELTEALSEELGGTERASSVIEKLIAMDILKHRVPLPEDDTPALGCLLAFLETRTDLDIRLACLVRELDLLEWMEEHLREVSQKELPGFLNRMHAAGTRAHEAIGDVGAPDWTGHLVFDNTMEEPVGHFNPPPEWQSTVEDLRQFLGAFVPLLDLNSCVRESMRHVLEREFQGGPVPFLQFALRYSKMLKTSAQGADNEFYRNPFGLESLRELEQIWREIGTMFLGETDGEDFDLRSANKSRRWTERLKCLRLAQPVEGKMPITSFVQPCYLEGNRPALSINSISAGPCGTVLRACNGLRDQQERKKVIGELSQAITKIWDGAQPCELRATFDFNPNIGPAITKRCIDYMSDPASGEHGVALGAVSIQLSEQGEMRLSYDGQELVPVSFGALARQLYPPVARLLLAMGGAEPVAYNRMSGRDANAMGAFPNKAHWCSPRFTYGSCVIRRKGWYFASDHLPKQARRESALRCFATVRQWQRTWELPDEVFVQSRPGGAQAGVTASADVRSFVSRKPQYINFRSYFLAESFADLIADQESGAFCEEALPCPEQWMHMGTGRPIEIAVDMCLDGAIRSNKTDTVPDGRGGR